MKKDIMEPLIKDKAKTETDKKGAVMILTILKI